MNLIGRCDMLIKNLYIVLLSSMVFAFSGGFQGHVLYAAKKLDKPLVQIEQRLEEESQTSPSDPNSLAYLRAVGERPTRQVLPRQMKAERVLTLGDCLQLAFANSNEIKQVRQQILAVGGSKLIANSRFLPTIELIGQYERTKDFETPDLSDDAEAISAKFSQRILEYGKDNPIDIALRAEQREALFSYENQVASILSQVRRAFLFIKLKEQQIATRQQLLEQFEKQYEIKQQRMEAGNLSVKIEVLTAKLNVLNEQTRINTLRRQMFNRKMDLLRLIGLPVGADAVEFRGEMDRFGLDQFDTYAMIRLALGQSSELALVEAQVAEQQRRLGQLRFEYLPDLRLSTGYQDEGGKVGADLTNQDDVWGLDMVGQPMVSDLKQGQPQSLGLFGDEVGLGGPESGWFAGVQLRLPIFEGKAREGRRIEAKAALNILKAAAEDQKDRIELAVRQRYKLLAEQQFEVELAQESVSIEKERFHIQEELRNVGKITDDQLETFRRSFFDVQDSLFRYQEVLIERQEDLRLAIRYFK
jgi:outer membrane protein TolC